jgi:hypothetical protein
MSPQIDCNFNDVPDEILPLEPGTYEMELGEGIDIKPSASGNGNNLIVPMTVVNHATHNGRKHTHYIFLNDMGKTNLKRMAKSAGVTPGASGLDTSELVGKVVRVVIVNTPYVDKDTQETKQSAKIKDFIIA